MNFSQFNLDTRLHSKIDRAGYTAPTPIQEAAIPVILGGRDLIGTAQTGTGKTAAFVLPMINKLLQGPRHRTRALIITPTRELAEQIHEVVRLFAGGTKVRSASVYGGVSQGPQVRALRDGVEIIIACPGRLLDLMGQGAVNLSAVEMVVLDEADRMLDMGFLPPVQQILEHVPSKRQTLLFSATFEQEVEKLAKRVLTDPQRITIGRSRPAYTVSHSIYPVKHHLKTPLLIELLKQTDTQSVLVFTRTKHRASRLADQIERAGYSVTSLHGDRTQGQRQTALRGFKNGKFQVMVATDIAARGLDVESISHVINFDMPDSADSYIHRIGRTGRAERNGDAFTLVTGEDMDLVRKLEKILGKPLPRETLVEFDYKAAAPANSSNNNNNHSHNTPSKDMPARKTNKPDKSSRNYLRKRGISVTQSGNRRQRQPAA